MGQRRKHVTQGVVTQDIQPPADNQHIVRALGSRGGNIVEVSPEKKQAATLTSSNTGCAACL